MTYPESIDDFTGFIDELIGRIGDLYCWFAEGFDWIKNFGGNGRRSLVLWGFFQKETNKYDKFTDLVVDLLTSILKFGRNLVTSCLAFSVGKVRQ
ncbi:hypothetical protein PSI23_16695 [Xenorhabdus sp. XENO-10]|uniref:Uncharacterized protein n=1 Tax=Xenorhabdus yunnanensis TaxID=3025878 RepID=A0ABT5LID7_9GAMM|nr:hypothetical protein [Xenorhabdus yunnanensis]MDC9590875.1 hypothetical protein [Xenorhabdus yunnanensis]